MIFKPAQLGMAKLDPQELEADKKACRKIGRSSATSRTSGTWTPCWKYLPRSSRSCIC